MREILFRGKRISNNEWVIGGIMQTFHPNYDCENEKDFFSQKPNCYCICANNKDYFVERSSIGQYTGLTDKNGTKIFEGDIVEVWYKQRTLENNTEPQKYKAIIVFGNPNGFYSWGYQLKMIDDFPYNNDILLWVEMEDTGAFVEVIGNIHDNPELLAKK